MATETIPFPYTAMQRRLYFFASVSEASATLASGYLLGRHTDGGKTFSYARWPQNYDKEDGLPEVSLVFDFTGPIRTTDITTVETPCIPNVLIARVSGDTESPTDSAFLPDASTAGLSFLGVRLSEDVLERSVKSVRLTYAIEQLRRKAAWAPKPIMLPTGTAHRSVLLEEFTPREPSLIELVPFVFASIKKRYAFWQSA